MSQSNRSPFLPAVSAALAAAGFITSARAQIETAGTLYVQVDATALPFGTATSVTNAGTLGGVFQGFSNPVIAESPGGAARGIQFNGSSYMQLVASVGGARINPPAGLVGASPTRSIEVWAFNPAIDAEETLVAWGRRGGPEGSNMSFNYGNNAMFGAVGHWGSTGPDLGWNDAGGAPSAGQWHHLTYTFDGTTTRVYADGMELNREVLSPGTINTHGNTSILLAAQLEADGTTVTGTLRGSLFIAKVRIHDGVLGAAQIAHNYSEERPLFTGPVKLALSPVDQTAEEGGAATFTAQATGDPPITYQWLRNGLPIAGATSNQYTIEEVSLGDQGVAFAMLATNVVNNTGVVSTGAVLSVTPDVTAPMLLGAASSSQSLLNVLDAVAVSFNEKVSAGTANNVANYVLTGPEGVVTLAGASLDSGGRSVLLTTAPLMPGASYTVTVSGILDRAAAANPIPPGSQASFTAVPFALTNVGNASAGSTVVAVPEGFDLSSAGRDIGGVADEFGFHARIYLGDFDVQARLESLDLSDGYSEAGLIARAGLSTNSISAGVLASPSLGGLKFQSRSSASGTASETGFMPVNYPHTWLRLRRAGNVFSGYGSFDGQTWLRLGSVTLALGPQVYLGFAVSSHNSAAAATARFRQPINVSDGLEVTSWPLPFEPLGPSSRRTGLIISEIMYHPPEVPGLSLEYVEIFNGQDYFEDLSGFELDGDVHYRFPEGTVLQSGGFLVVARDPAAVESHYGLADVFGPWQMQTNIIGALTNVIAENLPNGVGTVRLKNELGAHLLEVNYESGGDWPVAADGAGHSLVLARPSYGERDAKAWAASEVIGGSPGRRESYVAQPQHAIVINEFLAHTDLPQVDAVELFNASAQPVDVSGCWLSDDFGTNKFRVANGTVLPPRGFIVFTEDELGFGLSSDGEELFLVNSNRTRVLDSIRFGGQDSGVSRGRFPDGSSYFCELAIPTLGTNNAPCLRRDIVINEIMYHPISGNDDDEFIELHNRGATAANVGNWRFEDGINFIIPAGTVINSGGYLVVAKNRANLLVRYPDLDPTRVVGDYGGQLANGGERLALAMPEYTFQTNGAALTTNVFYIVVNEVDYRDGGRWGQWSDGGGSSLELIDPRTDNRLAANWADSDETTKAPWTLIERAGVIDLGMTSGNGTPNRFEFFIEGPGECLVDEMEVRSNGGTNRLSNPGFESGAASWFFQGTHQNSSVQSGGAFAGNNCLRLRAVERGDTGANRIRTAIVAPPTGGTNRATLRTRARWLRGDPNVLLRLRGQWMECAGAMTVPPNLGTPGAPNSRALANAGPAIYDVKHAPILPAANQPVIVTARAHDPDGAELTLRYRVDPSASLAEVSMRDDGTGGDAVANDRIYSASIPAQPANALVAFHLRARDSHASPATTLFPSDAPARECLVRFGESMRPGSIGNYRLWLTQSNLTYWASRERNSNEGLDCTFVYGNWRAVHNAKTLYSGSPWHTPTYTGPLGAVCDYEVEFPKDDLFLGTTDFVLNGQDSVFSFFNNDVSAQAETTAYWLGRKLGLGFNHKRHVFVFMNGQPRGMIYFDHQQPNSEVIEEYFPNDPNGRLHKIEDWFEFNDAANAHEIITCTLQNFMVGGEKRAERYRWTWRPRAGTAPNDFHDLFAVVDAANATSPEPLTSATLGLVDMKNWMRVFALQHAIGNWDTYGYERGKNCYAYKPTQSPWKLVLWDLDLVLGKESRGTSDGLFNTAGSEPVIARWYAHAPFVRHFWCAMQELVSGPMLAVNYNPLVDARFAAFRANGVPVDTPTAMKNWINARRTFIQSQIPNGTFNVNGTNFLTSSNNYLTLTGTAAVTAKQILVNGAPYPITWTSPIAWSLRLPLGPGTNELMVTAVDEAGHELGSRTVTVHYTGALPDPSGYVTINEIMFDPPVDQTSFLELYNAHPAFAFDLSAWRMNGLGYTFPSGAVLPPRSFLVLGRNRGEYAKLFSGTTPFYDQFDGALQNGGETLTLFRPGEQAGEEIVVDKVKYEGRDPWPAAARGLGSSVQLIDAAQDNGRVSNWHDGAGWRFYSFTGVPGGFRFLWYLDMPGSVFVDEVTLVPGSLAGVGESLIANGGFESPLFSVWRLQGTNGTNTAIHTGVKFSGDASLELRFSPAGSASQYLYQDLTNIVTTNVHTLSFWYLPSTNAGNLQFRMSSGFRAGVNVRAPSGPVIVNATPGASNAVVLPMPPFPLIWLNEALPENTAGLSDGAGETEPWVELYNSSLDPISLDGLYLSANYADLTRWAFPVGAILQPGEFKVVFADGEPAESTASEWHADFRLDNGTGSVVLSRRVNGGPQIVDYLNFDGLGANRSYGSLPDGQLFDRQEFANPTPGEANDGTSAPLVVHINEWMAGNTSFVTDPADNDADDWFEIYNPNPFAIDLGGYFLTDALTNPFQFQVPANGHYQIPPNGFLLVWADNEDDQNSTNRADLHVTFQLRQAGEVIALFAGDGTQIDAVTFGPQTNDVSQGRYPDGTGPLYFMDRPTPRGPNLPPDEPAVLEIGGVMIVEESVSFSFSIMPGRTYRVEYKDDLNLPVWTPLGGNQVAADESIVIMDNLGTRAQRFYRVVLP